jgi:hypothetical protein
MLRQKMQQLSGLHNITVYSLVIAAGLGWLLGLAILQFSPLWVLAGLLAMGFLVLVVLRPELGLLAILVMTSTIVFENRLPLVPIGIGSLHVPDVILLGLLGLIIVRSLAEPGFKLIRTPLDLPLLAFYGIGLLSTFIAVLQSSVPGQEALRETRAFTYYLAFFVVTNLVRKRVQIVFLIQGLSLLSTVVAGAMIAQFLLGRSVNLFPGRVEALETQGVSYGDVTRVLPPGQSLVMVAFIALVVLLVFDKSRPLAIIRLLQGGVLGLAVILTFNRNFWVAVGLGLLLLVFLVPWHDRRKLVGLAITALVLGTIVLAPMLTEPDSKAKSLVTASSERLATLFRPETVQEGSLQFRYIEYEYAIPQVLSHPLLGLGFGAQYRPWDRRLDWANSDGRGYIHNGHVWIMLRTGLLGYACFIWLSVLFVARGLRSWRHISDRFMQAILLAFILIYVGVSVGAIVSPIYTQWNWIPVLGIMMGTGETILRAGQDRSLD